MPAEAGSATSPAVKSGRSTVDGEFQLLGSDIFHDLSQPLSTLVCLLEVSLLISRPAKQLRHDLQIALKQARSIVRLDGFLRELWGAGNAQPDPHALSLTSCLREVVTDLLPVAESIKIKLLLTSVSDCLINFQASRLRQALFHLLEFALGSSAAGAEVKIAAGEENEAARVTVSISAVRDSVANGRDAKARAAKGTAEPAEREQQELKQRLGLAVARRIFETAGGSFQAERSGEQLRLEVRLPLVSLPK